MKRVVCGFLTLMFVSTFIYAASDFTLPSSIKGLQKKCDAGDAINCFNLAHSYKYGEGVKIDNSKAAKYYAKACNLGMRNMQGLGFTCTQAASVYYYGEGVKQDYHKAKEFSAKACSLGDAEGCYNLGFIYEYGKGVSKSLDMAKTYFKRSCDMEYADGCFAYKRINY
ncbi:hypothetical protein BKH43_01630 [Helicobacter sp. 13S00401-1]|uniref:tetratricopeptide repeat protein n=1 Tax=Helicobacter sp. 13S00401-1 TaxID=1905758 RepID=UPI000BA5B5C4|nr:tetratricopeptide repeat protein [Helicobacter sp. 13S00401-1]PAF51367.1 hypothetical protein BKH43_01630 [Helicobacter sp. 13S00401-1]